MLVTDKFVFMHLPRSGGTFVSEIIAKFFPSAREIGYHLPRSTLPPKYSRLPILGTVRNPWDFYVSWYHHQRELSRGGPLIALVTENWSLDFDGSIRNALNLGMSNGKIDALIKTLPRDFDYKNRNVSNLTSAMAAKLRGSGLGLYTFRFNQMFEPSEDVYFCRVESLRSDLLQFFEQIGSPPGLQDHVLGLNKKNISEHDHYSSYYTSALAELVAVRDRPLIERFGYRFETPD